MQLYLVRNTEQYGGGFSLTNYVPFRPSHESNILSWWFWGHYKVTHPVHIDLHREDANNLIQSLGKTIGFGDCINLTTGEVINIVDADPMPEAQPHPLTDEFVYRKV